MAKKKSAEAVKPRNDAYTVMLVFTFVAIVTGCVLMYLDTEQYAEAPPPPSTSELKLPKLGTASPLAPVPGAAAATPAPTGAATPAPTPAPAEPMPPAPAPAP